MEKADFTKWSNRATDWGQTYLDTLRDRPVRAGVKPGEVAAKLPLTAPDQPEPMETIFAQLHKNSRTLLEILNS